MHARPTDAARLTPATVTETLVVPRQQTPDARGAHTITHDGNRHDAETWAER
jgi:hypothetical protein